MAKENKPASAYAARAKEGLKGSMEPEYDRGTGSKVMDGLNISVGGLSKGNYLPEEKDGIKIRGTGAATKGLKARGPMA
jgi:hypothetical protein